MLAQEVHEEQAWFHVRPASSAFYGYRDVSHRRAESTPAWPISGLLRMLGLGSEALEEPIHHHPCDAFEQPLADAGDETASLGSRCDLHGGPATGRFERDRRRAAHEAWPPCAVHQQPVR